MHLHTCNWLSYSKLKRVFSIVILHTLKKNLHRQFQWCLVQSLKPLSFICPNTCMSLCSNWMCKLMQYVIFSKVSYLGIIVNNRRCMEGGVWAGGEWKSWQLTFWRNDWHQNIFLLLLLNNNAFCRVISLESLRFVFKSFFSR